MRTIMLWAGGRRFLYTFVTAAGGTVVAVIVSLITISDKIPVVWATTGLYLVLLLSVGACLVLIGWTNYEDFRHQLSQVAHMDSVPTLIVFRRRRDALRIDQNGDADLTWQFDVELDQTDPPRELRIPIHIETTDVAVTADSVMVVSVAVDGRNQLRRGHNPYEFLEVRTATGLRSGAGPRISKYGVLRVSLQPGKTMQRVQIRLHLSGIFPRVMHPTGDCWVVDVPYVTEEIEVTVSPALGTAKSIIIPPPLEGAIRCGSSLMDDEFDLKETRRRSLDYREEEHESVGRLVWTAKMPKLGYNYKIPFRLLDAGVPDPLTGKPSQASAGP